MTGICVTPEPALHLHPELFPFPLDVPVPRTQTPILTYVALLQSMGAMPGVSLQLVRRRQGGPNLYHSEDNEDGRLLAAQQPTVDQPYMARKYHSYSPATAVPEYGDVPAGIPRLRCQGLRSTPGACHHLMGNGIAMAANYLYNRYMLMPTGVHGRAWLSHAADSSSSRVYMAHKPPTRQS